MGFAIDNCQLACYTANIEEDKIMNLDKFGRITLPKSIRDHLGITTETPLEIMEGEDSVIIKVSHHKLLMTKKHGVLVYTGVATGDLDKTLEDIRNERLKDI